MQKVCLLGFKNDLTTIMTIVEFYEKNIEFDVCFLSASTKRKKFRYERFIGMSILSLCFWLDFLKQFFFNRSNTQKKLLSKYLPYLSNKNNFKFNEFNELSGLYNFIASKDYCLGVVCGFPILKNDFILGLKFPLIGCHPAPLPNVRGVDHLVFTFFYNLKPSVSIYSLNEKIDGGLIFKVINNDEIVFNDTFYSIRIKLEIQRAKELAVFVDEFIKKKYKIPNELRGNTSKLHQYKDVTVRIRKQADKNMKQYLKTLKC